MNKTFTKKIIPIINKTFFSLMILGVSSYILCVYNTVLTASGIESAKAEFQKLQVSVSEKEHTYIESVSNINIAYAEQLGYVRVPEENLAYLDATEDTALAMR